MKKYAVIVVGDILENSQDIFLDEFQSFCSQNASEESLAFTITQKSNNTSSLLSKAVKCKIVNTPAHDVIHVHGIYEVKKKMDQHSVLEAHFYLPQSLEHVYANACSFLFPPAYTFKLVASKHLNTSENYGPCTEEVVKKYLSSIPSTESKSLVLYQSKLILPPFLHGYSSRSGGISTCPGQASLNLCYSEKKKDPRIVVLENRARLARAAGFGAAKIFFAKAVHGKDVWVLEEAEPESYDAIVTNTPGVPIAAPGADCNMLLLADPVTKSCGAAHAGWKGILKGIVQETVSCMIRKYGSKPKDLIVAIGPSLSVCCCEFGAEESKKFLAIGEKCVVWKEGCPKPFLDLRLAVKIIFEKLGVLAQNIDDGENTQSNLNICTKCDPQERFFSFRRVGPQFGNQCGFIGLLTDKVL